MPKFKNLCKHGLYVKQIDKIIEPGKLVFLTDDAEIADKIRNHKLEKVDGEVNKTPTGNIEIPTIKEKEVDKVNETLTKEKSTEIKSYKKRKKKATSLNY